MPFCRGTGVDDYQRPAGISILIASLIAPFTPTSFCRGAQRVAGGGSGISKGKGIFGVARSCRLHGMTHDICTSAVGSYFPGGNEPPDQRSDIGKAGIGPGVHSSGEVAPPTSTSTPIFFNLPLASAHQGHIAPRAEHNRIHPGALVNQYVFIGSSVVGILQSRYLPPTIREPSRLITVMEVYPARPVEEGSLHGGTNRNIIIGNSTTRFLREDIPVCRVSAGGHQGVARGSVVALYSTAQLAQLGLDSISFSNGAACQGGNPVRFRVGIPGKSKVANPACLHPGKSTGSLPRGTGVLEIDDSRQGIGRPTGKASE